MCAGLTALYFTTKSFSLLPFFFAPRNLKAVSSHRTPKDSLRSSVDHPNSYQSFFSNPNRKTRNGKTQSSQSFKRYRIKSLDFAPSVLILIGSELFLQHNEIKIPIIRRVFYRDRILRIRLVTSDSDRLLNVRIFSRKHGCRTLREPCGIREQPGGSRTGTTGASVYFTAFGLNAAGGA
jgi:hypothetical protein